MNHKASSIGNRGSEETLQFTYGRRKKMEMLVPFFVQAVNGTIYDHDGSKRGSLKRSRTENESDAAKLKANGRSSDAGPSERRKILKASQAFVHGSPGGSTTPLPDQGILVSIIETLQLEDTHDAFSEPVDPELPDYYEVIKKPMDFGTMKKKLAERVYKTLEEFEADVYLICSNAMFFNGENTIYYHEALVIRELAREKFASLKRGVNEDDEDVDEPQPLRVATVRRGSRAAPSNKNPAQTNRVSDSSRISWNEEFPAHILRADRKAGNSKEFVIDMNRRHTFTKFCPMTSSGNNDTSEDMRCLVPCGPADPISYATSLARFAEDLGPVAWKASSQKIEGVEGPPQTTSSLGTEKQQEPDQPLFDPTHDDAGKTMAMPSNTGTVGYFTKLLTMPSSDKDDDDNLREFMTMPSNLGAGDRRNEGKLPKMPSNPETVDDRSASRLMHAANPKRSGSYTESKRATMLSNPGTGGYYSKPLTTALNPGTGGGHHSANKPPMTMPTNPGATSKTPSNPRPAEYYGLSPEMIEAVRKLNSQNALQQGNAAAAAAASPRRIPILNKHQQSPLMPQVQGNDYGGLLFQGKNQGSRVSFPAGHQSMGFDTSFVNYSPAMNNVSTPNQQLGMQQNWGNKGLADFSFAGNSNLWGFGAGSSSSGQGIDMTNQNNVSMLNQQPVMQQNWGNNSSTGQGINTTNPNNVSMLNQQPVMQQNWGGNNNSTGQGINTTNPNNVSMLNQQPVMQQNRGNNNSWGFGVGSSSTGQGINMTNPNNVSTLNQQPIVQQNWGNDNLWGFGAGSSSTGQGITMTNPNKVNQQPVMQQNWGNDNLWGLGAGSSSTGQGIDMTNPNNISMINQEPVMQQNWENYNLWDLGAGSSSAGQGTDNPISSIPLRMPPVNNMPSSSAQLTNEEEQPDLSLQL